MKPFCPHCGYDLANDQPIILNDYAMSGPYTPLFYRGQAIRLTGAERSLCWTLMKAYPDPVNRDVIMERMGSEAEGNVIDVYMSRVRKKFRELGAPNPFKCVNARNGKRAVTWVLH